MEEPLGHDDLILVNVVQLLYFSGYAVPLTLLIGWHPHDAFLWYLVVEAILSFVAYWVRIYVQSHDKDIHERCRQSRIVVSIGGVLVFLDTWATVVIGILLKKYWNDITDNTDGHSTILLLIACATKILYKTFNDVCVLRAVFEHSIKEKNTASTAASLDKPPAPRIVKTYIAKETQPVSHSLDMGGTM